MKFVSTVLTLLCFLFNTSLVQAQVVITPTLYCLSGKPCTSPNPTATPTLPVTFSSAAPTKQTPTELSTSPTNDPCASVQASTQAHSKKHIKNHGKSGLFSQLILQLLQLILSLLEKLGLPGTTPTPTPTPAISPNPTDVLSSFPSPTNSPTTNPCSHITAAPTQPAVTTNPTTLPQITNAPTSPPTGRVYPWHTNIISTTFWVGELFNASLADGSQVCSTYDTNWAYHWSGVNAGTVPSTASGCAGSIIGGCDGIAGANNACSTEKRTVTNGYFPTKITPKENPFYLDLPFDDVNDTTAFNERCQVIPWANDPGFTGNCTNKSFSYMKNRWVRIVGPNNATCYGQIEDAGPSHDNLYHDSAYVFGTNDVQPIQGQFNNAGADVSPALNGCLGFAELDGQNDKIKWQFVDNADVPPGPWKNVITTSQVQ